MPFPVRWRCALAWAALCAFPLHAQAPAPPTAPRIPPESVIDHLEQTLSWYRHVNSLETEDAATEDVLRRSNTRQSALHTLQLSFDFARADAALETSSKQPASAPSGTTGSGAAARNIQQIAARSADRVTALQARLTALDDALAKAKPRDRDTLAAQHKSVEAQLSLAKEIQKSVGSIAAFANTAGQANGGGAGLAGQVAELERTVPEIRRTAPGTSATTAPKPVPSTPPAQAPTPPSAQGLVSLIGNLLSLHASRSDIDGLLRETDALSSHIAQMRSPLVSSLRDSIRKSDSLATDSSATDLASINANQAEVTALATRFRQLSTVLVPLGEQEIVIENTRADISDWRSDVADQYRAVAHALLFRIGVLAAAIFFILAVSGIWRRAAFRYVGDVRRRRQFLVLRRIVVASAIALVLLLSFVSEFGSVATYAGLLTAGIALALQNVILSVVAYFFLIGRYGIRVGDRVTISGVNGEVIDMGLVRLYMMELAGPATDLHPTGRVVVYSNAILFQPAAIYKQMPGISYAWHSASVTLTSDSDSHLAETVLLAAVNSVYGRYSAQIEQQHKAFARSVEIQIETPHPEGRLRFSDTGLEFSVRYPVEAGRASEIDAEVVQALSAAINHEPKLTLALAGAPKLNGGETPSA